MTIGNGQFKFKFFLIFNTYGAFLRNSKKCRKHYTSNSICTMLT